MDRWENYGDWYDNGPGSEKFKRQIRLPKLSEEEKETLLQVLLDKVTNISSHRKKEKKKVELPEELFEI